MTSARPRLGTRPPTSGMPSQRGSTASTTQRPERKVLVLLSDGEHNVDLADPDRQPFRPRQAASLAANLNIPIYTIDAGGDPPADKPDLTKQRLMGREVNRQVAEMTGGKSFTANDGHQLLDVCRQIDAMERQPIVGFVYRRYHEYYPWLAVAAVGLAALAFGLDQRSGAAFRNNRPNGRRAAAVCPAKRSRSRVMRLLPVSLFILAAPLAAADWPLHRGECRPRPASPRTSCKRHWRSAGSSRPRTRSRRRP